MIKVLLRLKGLTTNQHRDLLLITDECGELHPLVQYNGSPREKGEIVVDLSINQFRGNGPGIMGPVSREAVDKLWDLLGIFPRTEKGKILREIEGIETLANGIVESMAASCNAGSSNPFESSTTERAELILNICRRMQALLAQK